MTIGYGPRVVTDGLVLALDAADRNSYSGSGTSWTDLTGRGNNGTLANGPTYSSDNRGSLVFDGTDDEITTTNLITNPAIFTICCWFRTTTASGRKILGFESSQFSVSGNYDRHLYMGSDGRVYFGIYDGVRKLATSTSTLNDGNWHYIVGTYGGEGTTMRLYVNGVSNATQTTSGPLSFNGYWRIASYRLLDWTVS